MKISSNNKKFNLYQLNNIFSNKIFIFFLSSFITFLWIFAISYQNFAKGIDFTDSTLTYNFSLRILKGEIPFKDFHSFVMPLAFYIEAIFHKFFGENILINSYLGLFIKFLQTYLIYLIVKFFTKNFSKSIIISFFIMALMGDLSQTFFSFTPLAISFSLACIYLSLLSINNKSFLIIQGIFIALTFLTKQNFGIIILFAFLFYQILMFLQNKNTLKNILKEILLTLTGIALVIIPVVVYFYSVNASQEMFYMLKSSSERKALPGIMSPNFYNSLLSFLQPKFFLPSILASIWTYYIFLKKRTNYIFISLLIISILGFLSIYIGNGFKNVLEILLYDSPKLMLPFSLFYICFLKKEGEKEIILFLIMTFFLIYINELSWPGRGPTTLKSLTTLYLFLLPFSLDKSKEFIEKKFFTQLTKKLLLIFNTIITISAIFFPKELIRRDFNTKVSLTLPPYLYKRKTSPQHKETILKSKKYYEEYCKDKKTFIFPWSPILYHFIDSKNATRFDLPYHDWLTEKEADEIIKTLKRNPPCLLIIDKESLMITGKPSPFPAKPMRKIEKFISNGFLDQYENLETLQTYSDKKIIFRKINL